MRSDSTKLTTVPGSPLGHTAQTLQLNRKKQQGQKVAPVSPTACAPPTTPDLSGGLQQSAAPQQRQHGL